MANSVLKDGVIDECAKEALKEFTEKGWRNSSPNALMLVLYLIQKDRDEKLLRTICRPMWWLIGVFGAGVVWMIISGIFFHAGGG
jgi:hypothetical protein